MRDVISRGNELVDEENINWWELFILEVVEPIQLISCLQRLNASFAHEDQIFVSRPCFEAEALRYLRSASLHLLSNHKVIRKLRHYFQEIWNLSYDDLAQIFWDKYDAKYAIRSRLARKRINVPNSAVLIPSAYVNASRTALNFVTSMPEQDFLLLTTRSSGEIYNGPQNLRTFTLASHVSFQDDARGMRKILDAWKKLKSNLANDPYTSVICAVGLLDAFPQFLKRGFILRNAWNNVLKNKPIQAILSCDNNSDTLLPVLLAKNWEIPTVSAHHGALDWRHRFLPVYADSIIAKGKMEQDHLVRVCCIPEEKIKVGTTVEMQPKIIEKNKHRSKDSIVFFSEAYEPNRARGEEIYREVLPYLAELAMQTQRKLIVKLHPFESLRKRKALLRKILSPEQMRTTKVFVGLLTTDLLEKAWFGVTILSTVAMECQVANVPCFVCSWLEYPHHGYGEQFRRFGVGYPLQSSDEIRNIPNMLEHLPPSSVADLWQTVSSTELEPLFLAAKQACS